MSSPADSFDIFDYHNNTETKEAASVPDISAFDPLEYNDYDSFCAASLGKTSMIQGHNNINAGNYFSDFFTMNNDNKGSSNSNSSSDFIPLGQRLVTSSDSLLNRNFSFKCSVSVKKDNLERKNSDSFVIGRFTISKEPCSSPQKSVPSSPTRYDIDIDLSQGSNKTDEVQMKNSLSSSLNRIYDELLSF